MLRNFVGAVQGEARRQRFNLLKEDSIQFLDRVCSETVAKWAKPGNDKLNSAFEKIDQVKGKMQENLHKIINNQDEVNKMEENSNQIQASAFEVRNKARKAEQAARRRRCRIYMMIGGCCLITLFILILIIAKSL